MKREVTMCFTSQWSKGNEICRVHSERKEGEKTARFWFTGWNPFPCFHMMSTYEVIEKWMKENGWEKDTYQSVSYKTDIIDDATGKVLEHFTSVYHTKVIREKAEEKTIPELLKEGKKISAVKLYYKAMGVSLKEAVAAIDTMKAQMGL